LPDRGGGTSLCNARAAYAALPAELKKKLDGMKTVNQLAGSARKAVNPDTLEDQKNYEFQPEVHPLVRTHPVTGRKALFVSPVYTVGIEGMAPNDADPLLAELHRHLVQEKFIYRHHWTPGMVVIWDNRCTMHNALGGYDGHRRVMHRTTVAGEAPV
jgi:taurine dioxygenase